MPSPQVNSTSMQLKMPIHRDQAYGVIPVHVSPENATHRYLLIQHVAGHWAFPKGHANDPSEEPLAAAKRELAEETGITQVTIIRDLQLEDKYAFQKNDVLVDKLVHYWVGVVRDGQTAVKMQPEEVKNYRWCDAKEARELATFDEAKQLVERVEEMVVAYGRARLLQA